ncbi:MAG: TonB-dependent receptor plug domain-containing protein [Bacteroidota bacterium]
MYRILFFLVLSFSVNAQVETDTAAFSVELDDFVITAQYAPTHSKNAMHSISTIKRETIEKIGAVTLEQALVLSPAVRLYEDPILGTFVRMRGVSSRNVAILVDGVPVIGRNGGGIDLSQLSLQNVEQIEIIEGPVSNLYGNNAAGGVINLIMKKSQTNQWSFSLDNQIESIGQRNHAASLGYQHGKINVGVHGRKFEYSEFPEDSMRVLNRDVNEEGRTVFSPRYPFNPKTQESYGAYLRLNLDEENHIVAKYDRNVENVTDFGPIKSPLFNPYGIDQFYDTQREDFSIDYRGKLGSNFYINALIARNSYKRVRDDKWYYIESMTFDTLLQTSDSIRFDQTFGRASLNFTGFKNWVIGGGFTYTRESGEGDRILVRGAQDSLFAEFTESAFYSDIKYEGIRGIQLSLSNRYTYHSVYDNAFTTTFQTKLNLTDRMTLRSSIAQGYRSPSLKELHLEFIDINHYIIGNPDLGPENSLDIQATLEYEIMRGLTFSLNGYYTTIEDRIGLFEFETLRYQYENIDEYDVYGFQPSVQFRMRDFSFSSNASVSYWATNLDEESAPRHGRNFDINNTLSHTSRPLGITLLINHRFVGSEPRYRVDSNGALEISTIENYHLIDFSWSKSFWKNRINVTMGTRNVLNTQSINQSNGIGGAHQSGSRRALSPGRSLFLGVNLDIN